MNQAVEAVVNEVEVKESGKSTFMQRVWTKMGKEEKGFTLIELLAVLVIIAIIAVIAIPLIGGIINNSKEDSDVASARQVYDASRLYVIGELGGQFEKVGGLTITLAELQAKKYVDSPLLLPSTKAAASGGSVVYGEDGTLSEVTLGAETYTDDEVLAGKKAD
ncbi:prepilin-type N-terminal cleavage/methylation domain-containing protein [Saccharibacillus sacchari]|uniref:prepilin-type N-terminal cleavage/methylation domain-containing protein n=1 Tax=Saccharibacillus sacchari TaxID=456493 RepID=UPI001FDFCA6F|nr:prepilin-type N-terminal cleavage/methylation domain-containing protein [Saccharibacillus sacchari]